MSRWVAMIVSLALVVASMDAALHFHALLGSAGPHELHGQMHDADAWPADAVAPETPAPDEGESGHFCHCGVHSPTLPAAFAVNLPPRGAPRVPIVHVVHGDGVFSPPLRPPNLT